MIIKAIARIDAVQKETAASFQHDVLSKKILAASGIKLGQRDFGSLFVLGGIQMVLRAYSIVDPAKAEIATQAFLNSKTNLVKIAENIQKQVAKKPEPSDEAKTLVRKSLY